MLREYALLADGERGILVGPRGDFAWMCFPRWDSDAIFSALIGGPGGYAITPRGRFVWGGYYEPGTLIWRSRWITGDAIIECREALALPARPDRAVILRRVIARHGTARVHVTLDPRAGFGHHPLTSLRPSRRPERGPPHRDDVHARLERRRRRQARTATATAATALTLDLELPRAHTTTSCSSCPSRPHRAAAGRRAGLAGHRDRVADACPRARGH